MDTLSERIFFLMQKMPSTEEGAAKAWVLGQIAGSMTQNDAVWTIKGYNGVSMELITNLLSELQVSYGEIVYQNERYYIPLK